MNEHLIGLVVFALIATITPGPNNMMLVASGALFGFKRTVPHILGVMLGYISTLLAAVLGLAQVMVSFPWFIMVVKVLGALWMCWLSGRFFFTAWSAVKSAGQTHVEQTRNQPLKFYQAFLFQWINPKSLVNSIACASAFAGVAESVFQRVLIFTAVFLFFCGLSSWLWVSLGGSLKKHMTQVGFVVSLNVIFALLLLVTVYLILVA